MFELYIQVRDWISNEADRWYEIGEPNGPLNPPILKDLPCPIDRLSMLVLLYAPILEKLAEELERWVKSYHTFDWNYSNDHNLPSDNMHKFLIDEGNKLEDFQKRFTSTIRKFVEKN